MKSKTVFPSLGKLFPRAMDELSNAYIARLCVLFEDLRIEVEGLFCKGVSKPLQMYWLRKSIGTCWEFAEAIRLLAERPSFKTIVAEEEKWQEAVQYFKKQEKKFWKPLRNDVGGHFGTAAALYAVSFIHQDLSVRDAPVNIEIRQGSSSNQAGVRLCFAQEIAAIALLGNLSGKTTDEKVKMLMAEIQQAFPHAIKAVGCLVDVYLLKKAGL